MHVTPLRIAISSVIASAALIAGATTAFAQEPIVSTANRNVHTAAVSYADLNLMTEQGVDKLTGRVRIAARSVCDVRYAPRPVGEEMASRKCYSGAMDRASRDIELAVASARSGDQLARNDAGARMIGVSRP
ncbi:UrcA family protein [Sphingomonas sp. C3-2]|uniref:UrcA family protein n=1 Tax=Sphingomonas sp. C3-2 TaxID=3062169 RepID=UPI00294AF5D5|nr:UrcA family protein [Sphingomonas sp. C3-2]WOK35322.1 UrcA family protein [Sphingomonas sp. C3-2]